MISLKEDIPRRICPGTRYKDFYNYPNKTFNEHCEQYLGISQYIEQAARDWALSDPEKTIRPPDDANKVDIAVWKYEMVRYFCKELNWLVVKLQGYCSPKKYPQMIATEAWIFLCAAHKQQPKECFAIDYMRHCLDNLAINLNQGKFSNRQVIKENTFQKLGTHCRRIYRLFAHAYYQHKQVYEEFESKTNLCQRFTSFCMEYNIITDHQTFIVPCPGAPKHATEAAEQEEKTRNEKRKQLENERKTEKAAKAAAAVTSGPQEPILNTDKNNDKSAKDEVDGTVIIKKDDDSNDDKKE